MLQEILLEAYAENKLINPKHITRIVLFAMGEVKFARWITVESVAVSEC